jgi:hypothetical protein
VLGRGPYCAVLGGRVGQELPDRQGSRVVQVILAVAQPIQLAGELDRSSGQGAARPDDHDVITVGVQGPAAVAAAG